MNNCSSEVLDGGAVKYRVEFCRGPVPTLTIYEIVADHENIVVVIEGLDRVDKFVKTVSKFR